MQLLRMLFRMRISRTTLLFLVSMIIFSIFVANVANLLNTRLVYNSGKYKANESKNVLAMTDTDKHLLWFLQISDLHISIFQDATRISEFREFCDYTIGTIKPVIVLASGDLTDAKTQDNIGSQQFEDEWKHYRNVLDECQVSKKTVWLDIRGNHDNFNVADLKSKQNFYLNYSIRGGIHHRSYLYQIQTGGELYSFIALDACLDPGPRRPFNFVGLLDNDELEHVNKLIQLTETTGTNYTIWFAHFPTSCIITSEAGGIRKLVGKTKKGLAYLCGHLHRLGGLVPKMYTLQQAGFLELELGDWKDNRVYRLIAIDHGLLSFHDAGHREWPVVLITNPKHVLYMIPNKENIDVIKQSTHIRILVFSLSGIESVKVRINDEAWTDCSHIRGPLYASPWNPEEYLKGLHTIEVFVKDFDGRTRYVTQQFALDDTRLSFGILARIALMSNASFVFKCMFGFIIIFSIVPLCMMRYLHKLVKERRISRPVMKRNCVRLWIRKLWILSTIDRMFWPLVLYPVYLTFGPWSVGYIIEDYIGIIFAWGILIKGVFLPGSFTYAYGFLHIFTFQIPFTLVLANGVDHRFQYQVVKPGKSKSILCYIGLHLPFIIILSIQVLMAYFFWLAYGTLAFVLGPLRTWSVFLAIILWHQAITLPEKCTREAAHIWSNKHDATINQTDSRDN